MSPCPECGGDVQADRCVACGCATRAGGFRVERVLARSPHGRVYLARGPDEQPVALKELVFVLVPSIAEVEAFLREGALLRELDHPRIPRFIHSFKEGDGVATRLYLAQQYVEGPSLLEQLATHRFAEAELSRIAHAVLELLEYLHGREPRVLHRDVKPANLLRQPSGEVVLVDFGAARLLTRDVTHRSTLVGTFGYMPPEQIGGTAGPSADLYALGATLLHLGTRKEPAELWTEGLEHAVEAAKHLSGGFRLFLSRLLADSPEERFASAASAREALEGLPTVYSPPESSRPRWVWAAAVAALTVGSGALVHRLSREQPAPVEVRAKSSATPIPLSKKATAPDPFRERVPLPGSVSTRLSSLRRYKGFECSDQAKLSLHSVELLRGTRVRPLYNHPFEQEQDLLLLSATYEYEGKSECFFPSKAIRIIDEAGGMFVPYNYGTRLEQGGVVTHQARVELPPRSALAYVVVGAPDAPDAAWRLDFNQPRLQPVAIRNLGAWLRKQRFAPRRILPDPSAQWLELSAPLSSRALEAEQRELVISGARLLRSVKTREGVKDAVLIDLWFHNRSQRGAYYPGQELSYVDSREPERPQTDYSNSNLTDGFTSYLNHRLLYFAPGLNEVKVSLRGGKSAVLRFDTAATPERADAAH